MCLFKYMEWACHQRKVWAFWLPLLRDPVGRVQPSCMRRILPLPQFFGPRAPGLYSASHHLIFIPSDILLVPGVFHEGEWRGSLTL